MSLRYYIEQYIIHKKYIPVAGTDGILYEIDSHAKTLNGVVRAIGKNTDYFEKMGCKNLQAIVFSKIVSKEILIYDDKIIIYS